jgi:hypothetical protein
MAWLLCVTLLTSDFPISNGPDGFTATKAIAAAADIKVTALVMRRIELKRLRLNQRRVFIFEYQLSFNFESRDIGKA